MCLNNEHGKPKFVAKADPFSTIRKNKLIERGEKLETLAQLRVFVSNISSTRFKRRYTRNGFLAAFSTAQHLECTLTDFNKEPSKEPLVWYLIFKK